MRPSKITTLLVDMIIKAHTGGLSRREIAMATRISERTLYQWLSDGKILYIGLWAGEIASLEDLTFADQEKIRLFEGLCSTSEKTPEAQMQEIECLIESKRIESEIKEHAREERNQARKRKERERNQARATERLTDRTIRQSEKHIRDTREAIEKIIKRMTK
jgi:hypothetical protein